MQIASKHYNICWAILLMKEMQPEIRISTLLAHQISKVSFS